MNKFYTYPRIIQFLVSGIMIVLLLAILGLWTKLNLNSILGILFIFLLVPMFQFLSTPLFKLTKVYHYLSPMLLVFNPNSIKYDIHNGTSFDYFWVMKGLPPGRKIQNRLLLYYLEGLLKIVQDIETAKLPGSLEITGTSYFFSETTVRRFGFNLSKPEAAVKLNLYLNYLDLLWMYSIAKGKLTFPKMNNIKRASITGSNLLKQKHKIQQYYDFLNSRT